MFDIIKCKIEPDQFGFTKFYRLEDIKKKIIQVPNLEQATKYKNKEVLIMLKNYDFDVGSTKLIAEKRKVCFLIDLGKVIGSYGLRRAILMARLRTFLKNCSKYGAYYSFASFSEKKEQVRTADELTYIAMLLGINKGQAKFALKMLSHYC